MEQEGGSQQQNSKGSTILPPTLCRISALGSEIYIRVLRIGDIWIPRLTISSNHFTRFYIPGVEDLLQPSDKILRVQHVGMRSRLLNWKIWHTSDVDYNTNWNLQMNNSVFLIPSTFIPLALVDEGDQSKSLT